MSTFLLAAPPLFGHLAPMVAIGAHLVQRGHDVELLGGRKYRDLATSRGLRFAPLPREADYDDDDLDAWLPDRDRYSGLAAGRRDILGLFVRPLRAQSAALHERLRRTTPDAVVAEGAFLGALPLVLGRPASARVPVVAVSTTPLALRSVDTAHFGSGLQPGTSRFTRMRNRHIDALLARGPLRPVQQGLDAALTAAAADRAGAGDAHGIPHPSARREGLTPAGSDWGVNYFDQLLEYDLTLHLSVEGFEYPRRELPDRVRFVGPVPAAGDGHLPTWWGDLDGSRPVVHVTQGTMDNADPTKLLLPTLEGLADEDVLVVASTGGRPVTDLLALARERRVSVPANARLTGFVPYAELLPRVDVVVTNGGFGGVQAALAHGVPLVVAGDGEDKPEVAARVAWSGSGVALRTGRPTPRRVRRAVRTVLARPSYAAAAARLRAEIADHGDPLDEVARTLEALTADERVLGRR